MEKINLRPIKSKLSAEEILNWEKTLAAGVLAQKLVENCVAVGGTAATIYAGHRLSFDTDHILTDLKDDFDAVLDKLSGSPVWKTARLNRPVLILGSINDCEVGFRQSRRINPPIETVVVATKFGDLVIPTLDEMIGMKAFLAYQRKTVRDFLDFAALITCTNDVEVIASLMKLDERYGETQTNSIRLEVARNFANPNPIDLEKVDLSHYKALASEWHDWKRTADICRKFGILLGEIILEI
jgi:hypothetical protein